MSLTQSQIIALNKVRELIDSKPKTRNSISRLVMLSNLSEFKLTNGFKELFGNSIYKYQLNVSMSHAAFLLQKGMTVKAVSIELGYKTPNNFTRAFIKVFKYPPLVIKNETTAQ